MDPSRNPFAPGAGSQPPELAGRQQLLDHAEITLTRAEQGRHAKSFMFVGLRGVGKTVLLNRILQMADERRLPALLVEAHEDKPLPELLLPSMRQILMRLENTEISKSVSISNLKRALPTAVIWKAICPIFSSP